MAIPKAASLVPNSNAPEQVDPAVVHMIAREVMVDNVRGQAPEWRPEEVKSASIKMRRLPNGKIEYTGAVSMASGSRGYDAKLYGQGAWNGKIFDFLDIVVIGTRRRAARFNQREADPGPAPMGVTLSLRRQ